jgi:hypothetical protein
MALTNQQDSTASCKQDNKLQDSPPNKIIKGMDTAIACQHTPLHVPQDTYVRAALLATRTQCPGLREPA